MGSTLRPTLANTARRSIRSSIAASMGRKLLGTHTQRGLPTAQREQPRKPVVADCFSYASSLRRSCAAKGWPRSVAHWHLRECLSCEHDLCHGAGRLAHLVPDRQGSHSRAGAGAPVQPDAQTSDRAPSASLGGGARSDSAAIPEIDYSGLSLCDRNTVRYKCTRSDIDRDSERERG